MEDHYRVQSTGKEPWTVGAGAPAFGPTAVCAVRAGCSRSGDRDVSRGLFRSEACLLRRGRAGAGWEAGGEQDAPWPRLARVRVCARWGGAGRVHGTGETRARAVSAFRRIEGQRQRVKIQRKTLAREPQGAGRLGKPSGRTEPGPRPAVEPR